MKRKRAYWKDIRRSVTQGKKRFISLALIAMLGVTMMCGLRASCEDLRYSADQFFDEQQLFDIRILSTLGLTDEDILALKALDGVKQVDGGFSETVYLQAAGMQRSMEVRTISEQGMNMPYLLEGRLPESVGEIVVTEKYTHEAGARVGDKIMLVEEPEFLKNGEYTITGVVIDGLDINSQEGALGFRSTASTDYVGYVTPDAMDTEMYSVVYVSLEGTEELNCYTSEYEAAVDAMVERIESKIKAQRETARYEEVHDEALEEWLDGKAEMEEEFAKADAEIADAKAEIADGKEKLANGRREIADAKRQLAEGLEELHNQEELAEEEFAKAHKEIEEGYVKIEAGKKALEEAYESLILGQSMLDAGALELENKEAAAAEQFKLEREKLSVAENQLAEGELAYENGVKELEEQRSLLGPQIQDMETQLADPDLLPEKRLELEQALNDLKTVLSDAEATLAITRTELDKTKTQLKAGRLQLEEQEAAANAQFSAARAELAAQQAELDAGMEEYRLGLEEVIAGEEELKAGEKLLEEQETSAREQIESGYKELEAGEHELEAGEHELEESAQELADGEAELAENIEEYEEEKEKAEKELADAKEEIDDIDMTKWYVQDRSSLSGYSNVKSDAASIQAIGDVFPILFLTVAILISLTTITRLVEEERGLIGTYKALGFTNGEIRRKYTIYAALACLIGGLLGDVGGYVILPKIVFVIFRIMYMLPEYPLRFDLMYGLGGILLFEVGIVGATIYTCIQTLKKMPAQLMRPKAPKAGSRVLLERIPFIWKRFSFLNKVTARNLFRYKKRLLMTVFGIAGCTALLLCGLTIKNSVSAMMPRQYQEIYKYELMAVASDGDFARLKTIFDSGKDIGQYENVRIETITVKNKEGKAETVQMIAVPNGGDISSYICLEDADGYVHELKDGDIFLSRNAARMLGLEMGDLAYWQNLELQQVEMPISQIVENYLGNMVYVTQGTYESMFEDYEVNGALAFFSEECPDQSAYSDWLARQDGVLTSLSTEAMEAEFEPAFKLLNMVVYVVLVLAGMLAFVVLFTLANTNISERERELATIKVLGFYNQEVHAYVNKETLILTVLGILFGMPTGYVLGYFLLKSLELSAMEFYIVLYPISYVIAGAITIVFALIVNFITNRTLDKINMVEALKSVE